MGGGDQVPSHEDGKSLRFNVFVTGFGPYPRGTGGVFEKNASNLVAKMLPESIEFDLPTESYTLEPSTGATPEEGGRRASVTTTVPAPPRSNNHKSSVTVNILNPTARGDNYVRTEYAYIRTYVDQLYKTYRGQPKDADTASQDHNLVRSTSPEEDMSKTKIDLFLHIGMAGSMDHVLVERGAFKQGFKSDWDSVRSEQVGYYNGPDNIGQTVEDAPPCPWEESVPIGLSTYFDVEAVAKAAAADPKLKAASGKPLGVKPHIEAGGYGCGFIYYESLAHCHVRGWKKQVLFVHVPWDIDEAAIAKARDAVVAVVKAAIGRLAVERMQ